MTRRIRRNASRANPFLAWHSLGLRVAQTMIDSSRVISHRTRRANTPAQLFEMGNEKVQAAMESSHALARHWIAASGRDPVAMWMAWPGALSSALAPFHSRARRNARLARRR